MTLRLLPVMLALSGSIAAVCAHAQNPDPTDIRACTAMESDAQRLACYDHATGRVNLPQHKSARTERRHTAHFQPRPRTSPRSRQPRPTIEVAKPLSLLDSRWELAPETRLGTLNLRGYRPIYVLPLFVTSHQNDLPDSPNPDNTISNSEQLDNVEAKFQLSLKTKVWQGVFSDVGDLWVGYTQSSRWQVYNKQLSRPFRETNYEPEAMLVFNTNYHILGWDGRMLGVSVDHQSNGRGNPLSRSWNRVIANIGLERDNWVVICVRGGAFPSREATTTTPTSATTWGAAKCRSCTSGAARNSACCCAIRCAAARTATARPASPGASRWPATCAATPRCSRATAKA